MGMYEYRLYRGNEEIKFNYRGGGGYLWFTTSKNKKKNIISKNNVRAE